MHIQKKCWNEDLRSTGFSVIVTSGEPVNTEHDVLVTWNTEEKVSGEILIVYGSSYVIHMQINVQELIADNSSLSSKFPNLPIKGKQHCKKTKNTKLSSSLVKVDVFNMLKERIFNV